MDITEETKNWYEDFTISVDSSIPEFERESYWHSKIYAGIFSFRYYYGATNLNYSFRIVLAP